MEILICSCRGELQISLVPASDAAYVACNALQFRELRKILHESTTNSVEIIRRRTTV